jgi:hypothetical protein
MNVFVVGRSRTGKTPMAAHVAKAAGLAHVRASAWARATYDATLDPSVLSTPPTNETRATYIANITAFATSELRNNPWVSVEHLASHDLNVPSVIEGIRNPLDFVHAYDPRCDVVIWLEGQQIAPTSFERGLEVIEHYLSYMADAGLSDRATAPVWKFVIRGFRRGDDDAVAGCTLDDAMDQAAHLLALHLVQTPQAATTAISVTSRVHADLPALAEPLWVRAEFLYGQDPSRIGEFVPCTPISISSYPGEVPTFQVRLTDGAVFSYLPPSALVNTAQPRWRAVEVGLEDLAYHNCVDEKVVVHVHAGLVGQCMVLLKHANLWIEGVYMFSVEWWTGNQVLHAVLLQNGQLALLPHHKIKFGSDHEPAFKPYRKIRSIWRR